MKPGPPVRPQIQPQSKPPVRLQAKPQAKPWIHNIPSYQQGQHHVAHPNPLILSSNENPLGPSPKAKKAYQQASSDLNRYPHDTCLELTQTIAKIHNLSKEKIICGAGTGELLSLIAHAYVGPGDEVLYSQHGFSLFPIAAHVVGATPRPVPEKNLKTDIEALICHITPKTKLIFLANPNNPTGSYLCHQELKRLIDNVPSHIIIVLDDAYCEYVTAGDYDTGTKFADTHDNVIIFRTFSKIYGLAGLRLGWGYGPPHMIETLHKVQGPFNISRPAQQAGIAAMLDQPHVTKSRFLNHHQRLYVRLTLKKLGLSCPPSQGNFLLINFQTVKKAEKAHCFLLKEGIILRPVHNYHLPHCLRMTLGRICDNKRVIIALTQFQNDPHNL